jgi:hypothetical protein
MSISHNFLLVYNAHCYSMASIDDFKERRADSGIERRADTGRKMSAVDTSRSFKKWSGGGRQVVERGAEVEERHTDAVERLLEVVKIRSEVVEKQAFERGVGVKEWLADALKQKWRKGGQVLERGSEVK